MRKLFLLLAVCLLLIGCKTEKKNTLEGVWERVEARTTKAGETVSPTRKLIKMFTKNHWVVFWQAPNRQKFIGKGTDAELLNAAKTFAMEAGTYTLTDNILTEYVEFAFKPNLVGTTFSFTIEWEGDRWIQTGTFPSSMGFGESDTETYEVWERIE